MLQKHLKIAFGSILKSSAALNYQSHPSSSLLSCCTDIRDGSPVRWQVLPPSGVIEQGGRAARLAANADSLERPGGSVVPGAHRPHWRRAAPPMRPSPPCNHRYQVSLAFE